MKDAAPATAVGTGRTGDVTAARRAMAAVQVLNDIRGGIAPTPDQRKILEQFPGWGPASTLFDPQPTPAWAQLADDLEDLAGDHANKAARLVDTSFYTPGPLIGHIYRLLMGAGFTGGPVLDLHIMRNFDVSRDIDTHRGGSLCRYAGFSGTRIITGMRRCVFS